MSKQPYRLKTYRVIFWGWVVAIALNVYTVDRLPALKGALLPLALTALTVIVMITFLLLLEERRQQP